MITKINDTDSIPYSRADRYWSERGFQEIYKKFRSGVDVPAKFKNIDNSEQIKAFFKYKAIQFGNWTTIEDRYNYLCSLFIASYDLNKILQFKDSNIGLGTLGISFGARGVSPALAHYEPRLEVINITRYKAGIGSKTRSFINSGGIGAFAHEYGHFLDYRLGLMVEQLKGTGALTSGRSVNRRRNDYPASMKMRNIVEDIIELAYWKKPYTEKSDYIQRVEAVTEMEYYFRRNEIFARFFEQYISTKLQKRNVYNRFLSETKYTPNLYLKPSEMAKVSPLFDKLLNEAKKSV